MPEVKAFPHCDLKEALHDAALSILDANGVSAVTIRAVAREVGVSHAAPVNHYKDRRSLLIAIAVQQFQNIYTDIEERPGNSGLSRADRIEAVTNAMLEYGLKHPNPYQLRWRRDLVDYADLRILEITDRIYDWLRDEIQQASLESRFDRDTLTITLWSMVHGSVDMRQNRMFIEKSDTVNGLPRQRAMLGLFRIVLGFNKLDACVEKHEDNFHLIWSSCLESKADARAVPTACAAHGDLTLRARVEYAGVVVAALAKYSDSLQNSIAELC